MDIIFTNQQCLPVLATALRGEKLGGGAEPKTESGILTELNTPIKNAMTDHTPPHPQLKQTEMNGSPSWQWRGRFHRWFPLQRCIQKILHIIGCGNVAGGWHWGFHFVRWRVSWRDRQGQISRRSHMGQTNRWHFGGRSSEQHTTSTRRGTTDAGTPIRGRNTTGMSAPIFQSGSFSWRFVQRGGLVLRNVRWGQVQRSRSRVRFFGHCQERSRHTRSSEIFRFHHLWLRGFLWWRNWGKRSIGRSSPAPWSRQVGRIMTSGRGNGIILFHIRIMIPPEKRRGHWHRQPAASQIARQGAFRRQRVLDLILDFKCTLEAQRVNAGRQGHGWQETLIVAQRYALAGAAQTGQVGGQVAVQAYEIVGHPRMIPLVTALCEYRKNSSGPLVILPLQLQKQRPLTHPTP